MTPLFLADESCDFVVVRGLRSAGFDVVAVGETMSGASEDEVTSAALDQGRDLLTEDLDFGRIVFADQRQSAGVILRALLPLPLLNEAVTFDPPLFQVLYPTFS